MARYPIVDMHALADAVGVDFAAAANELRALYADVDARNEANTRGLNLPCQKGCDACCHESVFLTPLEFMVAWDWAQANLDATARDAIVDRGLALYAENKHLIDALDEPPPPGHADHFEIAQQIKFRCPMLSADGACQVYPVRELYARMFGCSFNDAGGLYACGWVAAHLAGQTVTLMQVRPTAKRLNALPLTHKRQVYPHYFQWLYG